MEVHHHAHASHGKKSWKAYFWEFLMLFLAVFCGFLAENLREQKVENHREEEYMVTLLEDLKIDTATLVHLGSTLTNVIQRRDSVKIYLRPPIADASLAGYLREMSHILTFRGFSYNGRTVEQLRSSGNYRLIRKRNVTNSLIDYDTRMRGTFTKNYTALYEDRLKLIEMQYDIVDIGFDKSDFDDQDNPIIDTLKKHNRWPLRLLTSDPKVLYHFYNACLGHIELAMDLLAWVDRMKLKADELIALVQKEYDLK